MRRPFELCVPWVLLAAFGCTVVEDPAVDGAGDSGADVRNPGSDLGSIPNSSLTVSLGVTDANGVAELYPINVPDWPSLLGLELSAQWLIVDPTNNWVGLALSDALDIRFGT